MDMPPVPPSYSDARDCGRSYDGGWPAETSPTDSEDYGQSFSGSDFGGSGGDYGISGGGGGRRLAEDSES